MPEEVKPLSEEEIAVVRKHVMCGEVVCDIGVSHECDSVDDLKLKQPARLIATIDWLRQRNAELVKALERAKRAIHSEYCALSWLPCEYECVAATEALEAAKKSIFGATDQ